MKAIAKDPAVRYASAREFAADLRRFLAAQPVRARRPSLLYRWVRFSSRQRPAVIAAACALVLSCAAGTAVLWWENRRSAANLAEIRQLEMQERAALDNALGAIDQITLAAMESRQNPSMIPIYTASPRAVLHPIIFSQAGSSTNAEDDALLVLIAQALRCAGRSRLIMAQERGRDDFRRAIRIYEVLLVRFPERRAVRTTLVDTLQEYASLLDEPIDSAEAGESIRRALEIAVTLSPHE